MKRRMALICSAAICLTVAMSAALGMSAVAEDSYRPLLTPVAVNGDRISSGETAAYTPSGTPNNRSQTVLARKSTVAKKAIARPTRISDLARAKTILAGLVAAHPILSGTTVEMGDARGYQAVAFYRSGRIVISPSHRASLERILNHEVWHVIDYRDNGRIDWGENVPR